MVASLAGLGHADPQTYDHQHFDQGVLVDSTSIPIINTCLDPMTFHIDQANVTGGVGISEVGGLGCVIGGDNIHSYFYVPYTITCGNGVSYPGEILFTGQDDNGQDGEVSAEGGCGTYRTESWQTHQFTGYPPVSVDTTTWIMHNAMFSFGGYASPHEIGAINGNWKKFPVDDIKAAWRGMTVTLPPYPGGTSKLSTPVLFVHGLGALYTETWGVESPSCTTKTIQIRPQGAIWDSVAVSANPFGLSNLVQMVARVPFGGSCGDGSSIQWQAQLSLASLTVNFDNLNSYPINPGNVVQNQLAFIQHKLDLAEFIRQHPPVGSIDSYNGMVVKGGIRLWIQASDVNRLLPAPFVGAVPTGANPLVLDGVTLQEYILKFERTVDSLELHADLFDSPAGFGKGLVASTPDAYGSATGPDILARMQRLAKGEGINHNGIYFFNGYQWVSDSGQWLQPKPWWTDGGPVFAGQPGESWVLYNRIAEVLTQHYGPSWATDTSKKIDLVCHSQGGISTREMLAHAAGTDPFGHPMPVGAANAANHLRKVITVNTPHFGSTTVTPLNAIPAAFMSSVGQLLQDSARLDIELAKISIDPTLLGRVAQSVGAGVATTGGLGYWFYNNNSNYFGNSGVLAKTADVVAGSLVTVATIPVDLVAGAGAALIGLTSRLDVNITGNWLKTHQLQFQIDPPIGDPITVSRTNKEIDYAYRRMFSDRVNGSHLAVNSLNILSLKTNYPTLPNGQDLNLQPLYSSIAGMGDVIHTELAEQTRGLCDMDVQTQSAECYGLADILGQPLSSLVEDIGVNMPLMKFLDTYRDGWLAHSDVAVETQSQQALIAGGTWQPLAHPRHFLDPHGYLLRKATTLGRYPDSIIPHGTVPVDFADTLHSYRLTTPKKGYLTSDLSQPGWALGAHFDLRGAAWMGHDIYCALDFGCQELLAGTGIVLPLPATPQITSLPATGPLKAKMVPVTGDFQFTAVSLDTGKTGFVALLPGSATLALVGVWTPVAGLVVSTPSSQTTLVPPGWTTRPQIVRVADSLKIIAKTWNGQTLQKAIWLPAGNPNLQIGLVQPEVGADSNAVLVGKATLPDSLLHPKPLVAIQVWHQEVRGTQTNVSKPRIVVANTGRNPVVGIKLVYVFRADPGRQPVLDAPAGFPGHIEHISGDLWRLVIADPQLVLAPGAIWPSRALSEISLRYSDWSGWPLVKDPSEDRNWGEAKLNAKIAGYDGLGHLIWGKDLSDGGLGLYLQNPSLEVQTQEQAMGAANQSKPLITLQNRGNTPFDHLKATWYFQFPVGKIPLLNDWYTPEADLTLRPLGGGYWAVDALFGTHILYPGQVVSAGQWGVNLADWSSWDHSKDPSHQGVDGSVQINTRVVVTDATGKVLWGDKPALDRGIVSPPDSLHVDTTRQSLAVKIEFKNESPSETNIVKPRVRVTNLTGAVLNHFTLHFPIHAEPSLNPTAELYWAPGCSVSQQDSGSGNWNVLLTCTNLNLAPGAVWPTPDGAALGFHYPDWSFWNSTDDQAFVGLGSNFTRATGIGITP